MKTIKVNRWKDIPQSYIGVVEWDDGVVSYLKNGKLHREDGPARIYKDGHKSWWLDGKIIWSLFDKLDLTNQIIFSKIPHPNYQTVQIWKILYSVGVYEQIVIPGMEEYIQE